MNTESSFFTLLILIGGIYTIVGFLSYIFPPRKINYLYGYRTSSSMKSQELWKFAQAYSTKLMIFLGLILVVISVFGLLITFSGTIDFYIGFSLFILSIVFLFYKTERALKEKFPEN